MAEHVLGPIPITHVGQLEPIQFEVYVMRCSFRDTVIPVQVSGSGISASQPINTASEVRTGEFGRRNSNDMVAIDTGRQRPVRSLTVIIISSPDTNPNSDRAESNDGVSDRGFGSVCR